ncbi:MAG: hypothetical protein JWN39_1720, partial [Ilumatobacteraceae bacterium]|nr:hypothetical protein [Ilumatobacteraceae bacterium]
MMRLGLRLAVAGGREAITRLALIAIAVAIGSALLLSTLASTNAFGTQNERYAWLETGYPGAATSGTAGRTTAGTTADPLWWRLQGDTFAGKEIARVDVAATGPDTPVPPGISSLPAPGQFYASPELAKLLRDTPAAQLGNRYPGVQVGIIGAEALPAPDSLVIVIGRDVASLRNEPFAHEITQISTTSPSACTGSCAPTVGTDSDGMTLVLSVVAAALLFPVLIFIGGATRLSAARREQRFAAMRLVGATPRQISTISTVESCVATIVGVALGFLLFGVARPLISRVPFSGERFFTSDLTLSPANIVLVGVGVPVAAAVAARIALRRVNISPLGVSRRTTPRPPRPRRLVLMLAGIAWLTYLASFSDIRSSWASIDQAYAYLAGVFAVMIGLVVAGPWLTYLGSRMTARRARRPAGLIAARRLSDNPQAAFRAVSGLVLAVFVATCTIGIITTIVAYNAGVADSTAISRGTIVRDFDREDAPTMIPADAQNELTSIPGVQGVAAIHSDPNPVKGPSGRPPEYVACAELAAVPALGRCTAGAAVVAVVVDFGGAVIDKSTPMSEITWPAADVSADELAEMPIETVLVSTDASRSAIERARTTLEGVFPKSVGFAPETISEGRARNTRLIDRYQQLANVVLLTSLPIAGCSLSVSIAGGLSERRRPFSLLRLTGVPLGMLRRVVSLEA